ncbi:helix-turn-helix domain-containing protein [Roseibium litorale]|uniref:Helix-turn-helix transcriptional regulator n=1 Tax=Roseibium litorale TaxID=2803841 RepID=A0ABR9CSN0_9HYPH|nr:AraC family transcriptional regulator [Roseibium litorale]MBD8893888.1 helix-turn-helix transcriptional regulator [Roseibium litorale]
MNRKVAPAPGHPRKLVQAASAFWPQTSIETVKCSRVRPKLETFVFLEGQQSFWLDGAYFDIDAGHGASCCPKALTFVLDRETEIQLLRGTAKPLSKVSIVSPVTWLEEMEVEKGARSSELADFMSGHLNHLVWEPGPDVLALCNQISQPPKWLTGEMRELYLSARGLDMMLAVCQRIGKDSMAGALKQSRNVRVQMEKVRSFLIAHLDEELHIDRIARETGTSVRSLQRQFREQFGETVFDFVRGSRLDKAREALLRDRISVNEAALLAGYKTQGSFTTAFKTRYGDVPTRLRDGRGR